MFQCKSTGNVNSTGKIGNCEEESIDLVAKHTDTQNKFKPLQPSLIYFQTKSVRAPPLPPYIVDSREVSQGILFLLNRNMF